MYSDLRWHPGRLAALSPRRAMSTKTKAEIMYQMDERGRSGDSPLPGPSDVLSLLGSGSSRGTGDGRPRRLPIGQRRLSHWWARHGRRVLCSRPGPCELFSSQALEEGRWTARTRRRGRCFCGLVGWGRRQGRNGCSCWVMRPGVALFGREAVRLSLSLNCIFTLRLRGASFTGGESVQSGAEMPIFGREVHAESDDVKIGPPP